MSHIWIRRVTHVIHVYESCYTCEWDRLHTHSMCVCVRDRLHTHSMCVCLCLCVCVCDCVCGCLCTRTFTYTIQIWKGSYTHAWLTHMQIAIWTTRSFHTQIRRTHTHIHARTMHMRHDTDVTHTWFTYRHICAYTMTQALDTLRHTATHCNALQHTTPTHVNALQHTATDMIRLLSLCDTNRLNYSLYIWKWEVQALYFWKYVIFRLLLHYDILVTFT